MKVPGEQEEFWKGEFGTAYTERNQLTDASLRANFFRQVLEHTSGVESVCEFGCNRGLNLLALEHLNNALQISAVEINADAAAIARRELSSATIYNESIRDFVPPRTYDLTFTCGVLIHLNPDDLPMAYQKLYDASARYILINEYFSPSPVELSYRGHQNKLFKRDFGGEFWDQFTESVTVVAYGFLWRRVERVWDDTTWTLFAKK